jgi:hypothetical protein
VQTDRCQQLGRIDETTQPVGNQANITLKSTKGRILKKEGDQQEVKESWASLTVNEKCTVTARMQQQQSYPGSSSPRPTRRRDLLVEQRSPCKLKL